MSNVYQGITSGLATLKNYYQGPLVSQFNDDLPIWRAAQKGQEVYNSGQQVVRPLKVRRNQGVGAASDGGTLPAIGRQTTVQAIIAAKFNYLRFGITGPMIKASQSNVAAFVQAAAYELAEGYKDLKSDVNRQMSWDGTGDLARINTASAASTTLVIKGREDTEPALKFLDVGAAFDVYNGSTLYSSGHEVVSITTGTASSLTATIVITPAITGVVDYVLVRAGTFGSEIQGILTQMDGLTTTVFNIDRATYPATQGNVIDMASAQISLDKMQQADDEAERRGGPTSAIWTDFGSRRMYQKLLAADKRHVNSMKGDGGFSDKGKNYLEFNGKPVVADKDCPQRLFFLSDKNITKYTLCDMEFADEHGSMYFPSPEADSFEVRIRFFANMFNEMPAGSTCITTYISP
jgi:hypothetical protein